MSAGRPWVALAGFSSDRAGPLHAILHANGIRPLLLVGQVEIFTILRAVALDAILVTEAVASTLDWKELPLRDRSRPPLLTALPTESANQLAARLLALLGGARRQGARRVSPTHLRIGALLAVAALPSRKRWPSMLARGSGEFILGPRALGAPVRAAP